MSKFFLLKKKYLYIKIITINNNIVNFKNINIYIQKKKKKKKKKKKIKKKKKNF